MGDAQRNVHLGLMAYRAYVVLSFKEKKLLTWKLYKVVQKPGPLASEPLFQSVETRLMNGRIGIVNVNYLVYFWVSSERINKSAFGEITDKNLPHLFTVARIFAPFCEHFNYFADAFEYMLHSVLCVTKA